MNTLFIINLAESTSANEGGQDVLTSHMRPRKCPKLQSIGIVIIVFG